MAVTHDPLNGLPLDNGSHEQANGPQTRVLGPQTQGRALATPLATTPHVEAVVMALAARAAVAVVGSAGHHAKGLAVRLIGLQQMDFHECDAVVAGHDGFRIQVRVT